ncbi:MAG TPA: S8 family serine peptidase, partial [Anaerolineae bacterium]|nr:S8 family serine peptidase [Anaerolineae bacterium]
MRRYQALCREQGTNAPSKGGDSPCASRASLLAGVSRVITALSLVLVTVQVPAGATAAAAGSGALPAHNAVTMPPYAADRIIVRFQPGVVPARVVNGPQLAAMTGIPGIDGLNRRFGASRLEGLYPDSAGRRDPVAFASLGMKDIYLLHFAGPVDPPAVAMLYAAQSAVVYAEPDYVGSTGQPATNQSQPQVSGAAARLPNDPHFGQQWALLNDGSNPLGAPGTADADVDAELAWDITTGSSSIVVAVLDSGLKWDHPDIASRVWRNSGETPGNGLDDDSNGYVDDVRGWDFVNHDNNPMDDNGHGTNVSSIIGAESNNGQGLAGVDWHARIMPLKNLDDRGRGYYSAFATSIHYAVDNGAHVINMSEGGTVDSTTLSGAIDYAHSAGCIVVGATGNDNRGDILYPAAYANTIAVGATDTDDSRANPFSWGGGSNYGPEIDVVAPGNRIIGLHNTNNTNYSSFWGGTSQAAPHVSGLVALLLAQDPSRSFAQVRNLIRSTAEDRVGPSFEDTPGFDLYFGYGRVNAHAALQAGAPSTPTPTPTVTRTPTPSRTPTVTRTPTGTPTATVRSSPTATPTLDFRLYLPLMIVHRPATTATPTATAHLPAGIYGRMTYNGASVSGVELRLRFWDGSSWSTASSVSTRSDGGYRFAEVPSLQANQSYYVRYGPNSDDDRYLYDWYTATIRDYQAGTRLHGGSFDIANVEMISPASGSTVALPATFTWRRRDLARDTYRFRLFDPNSDEKWRSQDLGDVSSLLLEDLPPGAVYGREYGWDVWVCRGEDSCGSSYYYRRVTFSPAQGGAAVPAPSRWSTTDGLNRENVPAST